MSRPWEEPSWSGEKGRADDLLRKYMDAWGLCPETTTAYLCGHPKMIEHCEGILERAGWKRESILKEAYYHAAIRETGGSVPPKNVS